MNRVPASTYRLQITPSFTFDDARAQLDYLVELGVDWIYLSPVLEAEPGSDHGYDVVDHSRVDRARGGREAFEHLAREAHERGLGVLVDIVPNHMGVASAERNAQWWDVLRHGRASEFASWYDIDWDFGGGKVRIPVLGSDSLDDLAISEGELRYFEHRFPLAPGSADDGADPTTVHSRQHYELMNWRYADDRLNYRRFFAVNTLAAIRVEDADVYGRSHAEIARWIEEGLVDGLRVDHPDGLFHPGAYLEALSRTSGGRYLLVEKILEGRELLPSSWPADGTTGYDALADFDRVLVDPAAEGAFDALQREIAGEDATDYALLVHHTKRAVADGILHAEVLRLARDLERAGAAPGDASDEEVADALAEILSGMDVYRTYLPAGEADLLAALDVATRQRPDLAHVIDALRPALLDGRNPVAARFQQTSGMVMAKGVEDCAFYRYTRLTSLTEVGADPTEFGIGVDEFHARQAARSASFPASMTTLSTHDTKRGEDTRARIAALSEIPGPWADALRRLREAAPTGDGSFDTLLWQAVVGTWPAERQRLHAYVEKAAREAGVSTTWSDPDPVFEARIHAAVDSSLDDPKVRGIIEEVVDAVREAGWSNGLSAKLLQLAAPGMPDVYQGSELWERSLVDPDNRRPVDYAHRTALLDDLRKGRMPRLDETGAAKQLVVRAVLRARRDRPELFDHYEPVHAEGSAAEHVVGFSRGGVLALATRLPIGLACDGGWGDTSLDVGWPQSVDLISGRTFTGRSLRVADVLARYPVALLALGSGGIAPSTGGLL